MADILIVDDNQPSRMMLRQWLEAEGHTVVGAENGRQGLDLCAVGSFDLVITDIIMPEADGLEVIREMRRSQPDTGLIAISGSGFRYLPDAEEFGADRIFIKPLIREEFLGAVRKLLAEHFRGGEV